MSERLLEIGASYKPAIQLPGEITGSSETDYFAIEIKNKDLEGFWFNSDPELKQYYLSHVGVADSAMLPFADNSFSHVIMKSVFGEYTMDPQMTGSSTHNTFLGLYEAFRVLKPGGRIAIAEENTPEAPATPSQIGGVLLSAGFTDVTVYPCQEMTNKFWREERSRYWGIGEPREGSDYAPGSPIDARWGYLITANRPEADTEVFETVVSLNGIWVANQARGWNHPDNEKDSRNMTFQKAVKDNQEHRKDKSRDPWEDLRSIAVVPADGVKTDLETHWKANQKGKAATLFL